MIKAGINHRDTVLFSGGVPEFIETVCKAEDPNALLKAEPGMVAQLLEDVRLGTQDVHDVRRPLAFGLVGDRNDPLSDTHYNLQVPDFQLHVAQMGPKGKIDVPLSSADPHINARNPRVVIELTPGAGGEVFFVGAMSPRIDRDMRDMFRGYPLHGLRADNPGLNFTELARAIESGTMTWVDLDPLMTTVRFLEAGEQGGNRLWVEGLYTPKPKEKLVDLLGYDEEWKQK